jgi:hypothetical protein
MAVEVEALGQSTVTALVRDALESLLPCPLEEVLDREERERELVERQLRALEPCSPEHP